MMDNNYPLELIKMVQSQYLRYGDKIKLNSRSHYAHQQNSTFVMTNSSGYIGIYKKPDGLERLAISPVGENSPGKFTESVLQVLDPEKKKKDGDFVLYGDIVVLVDIDGKVWNNKGGAGIYFEGYIDLKPRNVQGEIFISFFKNGKKKQPVVYGEPGVSIQVESSNRISGPLGRNMNNKLTNFKYAKSKVLGGYVCCDGSGYELNFIVHPEKENDQTSMSLLLKENQKKAKKLKRVLSEEEPSSDPDQVVKEDFDWKKLGTKFHSLLLIHLLLSIVFPFVFSYLSFQLLILLQDSGSIISVFSHYNPFLIETNGSNRESCFKEFCPPESFGDAFRVQYVLLSLFICFFLGFVSPQMNFPSVTLVVQDVGSESKIETPKTNRRSSFFSRQLSFKDDNQPGTELPQEDAASWRSLGNDIKGVPKHPAFKRFLIGENNDMKVALKRWEVTCDWREEKSIDEILSKPNPHFDLIKANFCHGFLGYSKKGLPIYLEKASELNMTAFWNAGLTVEDLLQNWVFITEYFWRRVNKKGHRGKSLYILDLAKVKASDFFGESVAFIKNATSISQAHYPERSGKIYIINIPLWFNMAFKVIKPFMAQSTLKKVRIYRHGFKKELLSDVDANLLPAKYGGAISDNIYENKFERKIKYDVYRVCLEHQVPQIGPNGEPENNSFQKMQEFCDNFEKELET
eukprot:snap_masked-scaffold_33-processed-gene-3.48-mRNA-1 protein AED:1.00 eAED:1.00 QI:0/0/0/0/1/1/2/0/686